jgi:endonuclease/exonuclease/phosphatase family metal-dependent hydrolase
VLYKQASYVPVAAGGHWDLGTMPGGGSRWAAYQLLRQRATGAIFLFVSPHLYVGSGKTGDAVRQNETSAMVRQAQAYAAKHGDSAIVYAGDFNSHERHSSDGPAVAMRASHTADALHVAQSRTNQKFNSANQYRRTAMASGLMVDHIYASPTVAVAAWRQILKLSRGRFVGVIPSDHNPVVADLLIPA